MMNNPLEQIRVVLVGATHPGNIGAAARAMANMGLARLHLVSPREFPSPVATAMASGADRVLDTALVHAGLAEALAGCTLVIGTSARRRSSPWPVLEPREAGVRLVAHAARGEAALVFGPEQSGLGNKELEFVHRLVHIPVVPGFASLNLAASVMILAYEVRRAWLGREDGGGGNGGDKNGGPKSGSPLADAARMDDFHRHFVEVMTETGFLRNKQSTALIRKLKLLFQRAHPTMEEINILRGILSSVQKPRK